MYTLNRSIILLIMMIIPISAGSDSPESWLRSLTPFNSDSMATGLATHYPIPILMPYLRSTNPMVLQTIYQALAQAPNFPMALTQIRIDSPWQIRGLIQSAHYYCIRYPKQIGLLPFSLFYPLARQCSDPKLLIPLADLLQFDDSESSRDCLRLMLSQPHPVVRRYAIHSLSILADPRDRPLVQSQLDCDDFFIQFTARQGLQRFQGEKP